jgi:hypothetical protein
MSTFVNTHGKAVLARSGSECAVCGAWKSSSALLCRGCLEAIDQPTRNRLASTLADFVEVVVELRLARKALAAGIRLVPAAARQKEAK